MTRRPGFQPPATGAGRSRRGSVSAFRSWRRRLPSGSLLALAGIGIGFGALSQEEAAPQTAGLDPGAPPGAEPTASFDRPFDRYAVPVRPATAEAPGTRDVQGRVAVSAFRLDDPEATTASAIDGYRNLLMKEGFEPVLDCADSDCGGFDFRFAVTLLPAPAMLMDATDFAQLTMRRPTADRDGASWVSVLASRVLDALYVQTAVVEPTDADPVSVAQQAPDARADDEMPVLPEDLDVLENQLQRDGHLRVAGLDFEEGGATLSPGSAPALDRIAALLKRRPDMAVAIVGHSDDAGPLDINMELSRQRAEAVEQALLERGVLAEQTESHGIGWLAPVTANDDEAGRRINRRVEMVLR